LSLQKMIVKSSCYIYFFIFEKENVVFQCDTDVKQRICIT